MRIVYAKIMNYRCIKQLDFKPSTHNILIGRVNSGKSTLLNALSLVLDPDVGRRYRPVEELDFFEGTFLDDKEKPIPIIIEVTLSHCSEEERNYFLEFMEPWNVKESELIESAEDISILDNPNNLFAFRVGFQAKYDPDEKEIIHYWYYPKYSFLGDSGEWRQCSRSDRGKVGFFLIQAERDISKALSFTRYSALDKALRADKISLDEEIGNISKRIQGVGEVLFNNKDFEKLIDEVVSRIETMIELNPEISKKLTFELSGLGHYELMNILKAFVAPEGAPRAYPVTNQGVGAKQIITLATLRMLASRKKSCIMAIEEPENNLHPYMQRTLVNDLLSTNCQTFITTHSVHVAQVVQQEYLYSVIDAKLGVKKILSVLPSREKGLPEETVKALKRIGAHYPLDLLDCLFAPRVLLVEGVGDREALPVLIRKVCNSRKKQDLDGLGVEVMPCNGKSGIPKIAPYFQFLGKIVYALADNEKNTSLKNDDIVSVCDSSFFWPEGTAIEMILLEKVSEKVLDEFIASVTELGENFFEDSGTHAKDFVGRKQDVLQFLKKRLTHRQFAEFIPEDQVSDTIITLIEELNLACSGKSSSREIILHAAKNP